MLKYVIRTLIPIICVAGNSAYAQQAHIEPDANIASVEGAPNSTLMWMADPAVGMIRASGHRCDSISAMRPASFSVGLTVVCNGNRYEYNLEDQGGRWQVTLQ
jgi:hypothetical protein